MTLEYIGLAGLPEKRIEQGADDAVRATCPVLAPFHAARPAAIGVDPMATGAQRRGLQCLRSNEVAGGDYRVGLKILVSAVQSRPCPPVFSASPSQKFSVDLDCDQSVPSRAYSSLFQLSPAHNDSFASHERTKDFCDALRASSIRI